MIDDGSRRRRRPASTRVGYEDALAAGVARPRLRPALGRRHRYVIYTGGTTGMPKGVMWRQRGRLLRARRRASTRFTGERVPDESPPRREGRGAGRRPADLPDTPPLMHGAAPVGSADAAASRATSSCSSAEVRRRRGVATRRARSSVNSIAHHRRRHGPPADRGARVEPPAEELDLSSLVRAQLERRAVFSPAVKDQFLERFPNLVLTDSIGSTESGFNGIRMVAKGETADAAGGPTVDAGARHRRARRRPRTDRARLGRGRQARPRRQHPARLLQGPGEDGGDVRHRARRQALRRSPATSPRVEADGTITLLGRGSVCINTGGEKIYPEEVE